MPPNSKSGGCGGGGGGAAVNKAAAKSRAPRSPARRWTSLQLLFLISPMLELIGGGRVVGCTIPHAYRGSWLQYGYPNNSRVLITATDVQGKGRCAAASDPSRGQYVLYKLHSSDEGSFVCYTCLVITRRSDNVLQYKETNEEHMRCDPANNQLLFKAQTQGLVENICSSVGPDDMLHTLVKETPQPVACPFHGSFAVEHSRHGGPLCKTTSPLSTIEQCASDTQQAWLLRRCSAIPDSEGFQQEFQCLGSWNDGDNWLYVRSKGDYRCIRYASTSSGQIILYVSDDSACTSVLNQHTSPWVLKLSPIFRGPSHRRGQPRCSFPSWLSEATWRDMMTGDSIELGNQRITHLQAPTQALIASRPTSYQEHVRNITISRTTCINAIGQTGDHLAAEDYLVGVMEDCTARYQCLRFIRVADGVAFMRKGKATPLPDGACSSATTSVAAITAGRHPVVDRLLIASGVSASCPFVGRYRVVQGDGERSNADGCVQRHGFVLLYKAGCRGPASFDIVPACHNTQEQQYECLASWATAESKYVIIGRGVTVAAATSGQQKDAVAICYSYTVGRSGDIRLRRDHACTALSLPGAPDRGVFPHELHLSALQQPASCATEVEKHRKSLAPNSHAVPSVASEAAASCDAVASLAFASIVSLLLCKAR